MSITGPPQKPDLQDSDTPYRVLYKPRDGVYRSCKGTNLLAYWSLERFMRFLSKTIADLGMIMVFDDAQDPISCAVKVAIKQLINESIISLSQEMTSIIDVIKSLSKGQKLKGGVTGRRKEGKMSDCISREAVIKKIRFEGIYGDGYSDEELENGIVDMIKSIPAADVQPVRHGRWVTREVLVNPIDGIWRTLVECSECGGEAFKHEVYGYQRDNFCHLCGADLRETEK